MCVHLLYVALEDVGDDSVQEAPAHLAVQVHRTHVIQERVVVVVELVARVLASRRRRDQ